MTQVWDVAGFKHGEHLGVNFEFDTETRLLRLNFVILSLNRSEDEVTRAITKAFDLLIYSDHIDLVLGKSEKLIDWVVGCLEAAEEILNRQVAMVLPH